MNAVRMLKLGLGVAIALFLGFTAVGVFAVRHMFEHKVFEGEPARRFIASHSTLSQQWHACGLDDPELRIVRVVAARGALQSGSRFLAVVDIQRSSDAFFGDAPKRDTTRLKDSVVGLDVIGAQFQVARTAGHDGPEIIGVVPRDSTATVIVYAYAGDGG